MVGTIFRFTASSATSREVQWPTGRCESSSGCSQAMAMISTICSGVKVPPQPARGASTRTAVRQRLRSEVREPSSAAANCSWAAAHRLYIHAQTLRQVPVEPSLGGSQDDPRPIGQALLPRRPTDHTLQHILLPGAELDHWGDSHVSDVLLAMVRGGRRGKRIGHAWG